MEIFVSQRPRDERQKTSDRLCPSVIDERECKFGDKCKFSHDVSGYLATKLPDLGDTCFMYDTYGKCHFGITCRCVVGFFLSLFFLGGGVNFFGATLKMTGGHLISRFASKHLDGDNRNLQNEELVKSWTGKKTILNVLQKESQVTQN